MTEQTELEATQQELKRTQEALAEKKEEEGWTLPKLPVIKEDVQGTLEQIQRVRRCHIQYNGGQDSPKIFQATYLDELGVIHATMTAHLTPNIKTRLAFVPAMLAECREILNQTIHGGDIGQPTLANLITLWNNIAMMEGEAQRSVLSYSNGPIIRDNEKEVDLSD